MPTLWVREFTGGLDTRRMPEAASGGVLMRAKDGHITRGGEFQKRPAFVPAYGLPNGTVGLAYDTTRLVVFGHAVAPPLPPQVGYQRLQHPDGVTALTAVPSFDLYAGKIYAVGEFADGSRYHFYDGARVTDWFDGRARAQFRVSGGTAGAGNDLTSITVAGVSIMTGAVAHTGSNITTATAIANAVNAASTSPDYTATAVGDVVNIIAATAGAAANGRQVVFAVSGNVTVTPAADLVLSQGADAAGTFTPGSFVKTIGSRVTSVSGPNAHGSGLRQPTKWTTDTTGAFFIDMSTQAAGAEALSAIAKYQQFVAVFAERVVQIWQFDSDPNNNRQIQVLNNTGTASARSVTQFGDADIFFCDESGLRSLRARDSSNAAATSDIGVPVDTLITETLAGLVDRSVVIGAIEPSAGRFWLAMGDVIFVFSYFPGAKVSAWSTYTPVAEIEGILTPFTVEHIAVFGRRVYLRGGNRVYAFGGLGAEPVYDSVEAEAWTPYFDGGSPTTPKTLTGLDAALEGSWEVRVAAKPADENASDLVARLTRTTFSEDRIGMIGSSTHFQMRFKTIGRTAAKLASIVVTYSAEGDAPQTG